MPELQTVSEPELTYADDEAPMNVACWLVLWGCDPHYDRPPRLPGDGYIFYNYSPECGNLDYLEKKLLPAIGRQLLDKTMCAEDHENFEKIQTYIVSLLATGDRKEDRRGS